MNESASHSLGSAVAGEWLETTLGDAIRFVSGGTPSKSQAGYWGGDTPWISAKDMKAWWLTDSQDQLTAEGAEQAAWIAPAGTALILVRGMTLHNDVPIVRVRRASAFNQDVKAAVPRQGVAPEFAPYLLAGLRTSLLSRVDSAGHGTGRIHADVLRALPIRLPPAPEQERIADLLSALDDRLERNRQKAETLEATARALFKSWFVDFDPVRAKAEDRPTGLCDDVDALFPRSFSDDGLPVGWTRLPLREILDISKGNSYKSSDLGPSRTALVTLKSFARGGGYRRDGLKGFTGPYKSAQCVSPGDLLIAATDVTQAAEVVGQPVIVESDPNYDTLVASLDTFIARPRMQASWFWCLALREQGFVNTARGYTTGTTVLHLSSRVFDDFSFQLPANRAVPKMASEFLWPLVERRSHIGEESVTVTALRDTLLPKLISGELRVREVERAIMAVA